MDLSQVAALREELTGRIESYGAAVEKGIAPNAAAKLMSLPIEEIEGGDVPLMTDRLIPLADVIEGSRNIPFDEV